MTRMSLFALTLIGVSAGFAAPGVVAVTPAPQSMTAVPLNEITIRWDTPLDSTTVGPGTIMVAGRWSGIPSGTFSLEDGNTLVRFTPSEPFSAGEWVTVAVSRRVLGEAGDSMETAYAWNFWTKAGPGMLDQTEIEQIEVRLPGEPHIQTYGAHAADLNNDGWTDITLPNELSDDVRIFLNDGSGGYADFTIHPIPNGSFASTNEALDLDGDADFDYVVGNGGNNQVCVFIGDGQGSFESATTYQAGNSVRGVAGLDLEGDGDLDVVTANRSASNLSIFINNGDGTLQPAVPMEANGTQETACAPADANNDGIMDLFVGALGSNEIILLLGDGHGGLSFSSKVSAGGSPWMIATGDINGDGNVDVASSNSFSNNAGVVFGDGLGGLTPAVTYPVGNFSLAIDLGDIDGDGDLDLVTSNYGSANWTVYENDGTGVYMNQRSLDASSAGSCATLHDRDNDGDLDITGIDEIDDLIFIFENELPVSVGSEEEQPVVFDLSQNYPNPFNSISNFEFEVPQASLVTLTVFDLLGRPVATIVNEHLPSGTYRRQWDAGELPSGVYYYRLEQAGRQMAKALVLLR